MINSRWVTADGFAAMITPPFGCCEGAGADSSDPGWNRLKYTKRDFPMRAPRKRSRCHHGRFRALPTIEPRRQAATLRVSRSADCEAPNRYRQVAALRSEGGHKIVSYDD